MDAITLQNRIYAGYAQAAKRLGLSYAQFRPASAVNPLATQTGNLLAAFNAEDMSYGKPNRYGDPVWYGLFDGRLTQAGDYLVGPGGTYFIASQQLHLPIQCVECNGVVRASRVASQSGVGMVGYGGPCGEPGAGGDDYLIGDATGAGWPASILLFGQREKSISGLPSSSQQIGWRILLPKSVPLAVVFQASDTLSCNLGRRYVVQGAELTDMGWRLTTTELHA
ncbi:hypothetical protein [Pandoraea apista]|uniref:Uncharacterized protein n=1 Tax=Pandoraea apista TaxID=93218 RepID=A0A5E5P261_9BURK|nr:hypothetical protein [Pandoraea apista]OXS89557.1 hypothetical protein B7H01_19905 [Pandoraea apista]VVG70691.1 hypothetical protein PAP18089_01655 [Pandoraea apista]